MEVRIVEEVSSGDHDTFGGTINGFFQRDHVGDFITLGEHFFYLAHN